MGQAKTLSPTSTPATAQKEVHSSDWAAHAFNGKGNNSSDLTIRNIVHQQGPLASGCTVINLGTYSQKDLMPKKVWNLSLNPG